MAVNALALNPSEIAASGATASTRTLAAAKPFVPAGLAAVVPVELLAALLGRGEAVVLLVAVEVPFAFAPVPGDVPGAVVTPAFASGAAVAAADVPNRPLASALA